MPKRGVIARLTSALPPQFLGRYHHSDSYPASLGKELWNLYYRVFECDLSEMMRVLIDLHPAGWSQLCGAQLDPQIADDSGIIGCYCHNQQPQEEWKVTDENAARFGCEWAYAFVAGQTSEHDLLMILATFHRTGARMTGMFGHGEPQAVWAPLAVIALRGDEPDWEQLETAKPLDPHFSLQTFERGVQEETVIQRDRDRSGIYLVRAPNDAPHYVSHIVANDGLTHYYCTCSVVEDAESPHCPHTQAVRVYAEEIRKAALKRQNRGLEYQGQRLSRDGFNQISVFVWEGGEPSILSPLASQRLFNHASTFEWGYEASGPAQLALAILFDFTGEDDLALRHHQEFKRQKVARLPRDSSWRLTGAEIRDFLMQHQNA